jgi:hypothetical protein
MKNKTRRSLALRARFSGVSSRMPYHSISAEKRKQIAMLAIFLACSILISSYGKSAAQASAMATAGALPTCKNECFNLGQNSCYGSFVAKCGNFDSDSCMEWGKQYYCQGGCSGGRCKVVINSEPAPQKCDSWCAQYADKYYDWKTVCEWYPDCHGCAQCA